jgi:hypothetical protein
MEIQIQAIKTLTEEVVRIDENAKSNLRRIESLEIQADGFMKKKGHIRRMKRRANNNANSTELTFLLSKLLYWFVFKMTKKDILLVILILFFIVWLFCRTYTW